MLYKSLGSVQSKTLNQKSHLKLTKGDILKDYMKTWTIIQIKTRTSVSANIGIGTGRQGGLYLQLSQSIKFLKIFHHAPR